MRLRPDLKVSLLRGNVETRLGKAERGEIDATLLAYAGLKRLGLAHRATALLDTADFLPAVGQGAIGLTARSGDAAARDALDPILHGETGEALACERAFLAVLDGSCRTPIAGHARRGSRELTFRGAVFRTRRLRSVRSRGERRAGRRRQHRRGGGTGIAKPAAEGRAGGLTVTGGIRVAVSLTSFW